MSSVLLTDLHFASAETRMVYSTQ